MEQALTIINYASLIILFCFIVTTIWLIKSKYSKPSMIAQMLFGVVVLVLEISQLVCEASLGKEYASTIVLIGVWVVYLMYMAYLIGIKTAEERIIIHVATKILTMDERENEVQKD